MRTEGKRWRSAAYCAAALVGLLGGEVMIRLVRAPSPLPIPADRRERPGTAGREPSPWRPRPPYDLGDRGRGAESSAEAGGNGSNRLGDLDLAVADPKQSAELGEVAPPAATPVPDPARGADLQRGEARNLAAAKADWSRAARLVITLEDTGLSPEAAAARGARMRQMELRSTALLQEIDERLGPAPWAGESFQVFGVVGGASDKSGRSHEWTYRNLLRVVGGDFTPTASAEASLAWYADGRALDESRAAAVLAELHQYERDRKLLLHEIVAAVTNHLESANPQQPSDYFAFLIREGALFVVPDGPSLRLGERMQAFTVLREEAEAAATAEGGRW